MRWRNRRGSQNVEDRRGSGGGLIIGGGLGTIVLVVLALLFGVDPQTLFNQLPESSGTGTQTERPVDPAEERLKEFSSVVLADTEDVWNQLLPRMGEQYREPTMVLFTDRVDSACGSASSAVGPFYCSGDERIYLDLSFFNDLHQRYGAPGDFAQAYVIAHEVGHHVQNQLGITRKVASMQQRMSKEQANELSVRLELQADFFAGVWAHHADKTKNVLEPGDIEEALNAASAIGDDRLQKRSQGHVVPESFTHGTSEQRSRWFRKGFETGDPREGDTFAARSL